MTKVYGWDIPNIQQVPLENSALLQIGRIIRAISEIEICLNCIILQFTKLNERHYDISLGTAGIKTKLGIIENLSRFSGAKFVTLYKTVFHSSFFEALSCRNFVAHGAYIGKASSGEWMFLSNTTITDAAYSPDKDRWAVVSPIMGVTDENLTHFADSLETFIPFVVKSYRIESLREKYLRPNLVRHKHARKPRSKKKGRSAPPQS